MLGFQLQKPDCQLTSADGTCLNVIGERHRDGSTPAAGQPDPGDADVKEQGKATEGIEAGNTTECKLWWR